MLHPCRDCKKQGRCDQEKEKSRLALFAWAHGSLVGCTDREESAWHGVEGVSREPFRRARPSHRTTRESLRCTPAVH